MRKTGTASPTALYAHVTGRVQGVWFRGWTKERADALGLDGWVRNEADGSVTALIAGPADRADALVAALHRGPPAARVSSVATEPAGMQAVPEGFRIIR